TFRCALDPILQLRECLTRADDYRDISPFTALERRAVDLAVEIDRHAVGVLYRTLDRRKHRLLAPHALDHRVDVTVRHLRLGPFDRDGVKRFHLDLGQHLENRGVLELRSRTHGDRLYTRTSRGCQLLLAQRL